MENNIDSLQYIINSLDKKQRELLLFLLLEEKNNIEPFIKQNEWVKDRTDIIDSILSMINN